MVRKRLGSKLRELREQSGWTQDDAAKTALRATGTKLSRMENGNVSIRPNDVDDLLKLYKVVDDELSAELIALARESKQQGWWHIYGDAVPPRLEHYLGLEAVAKQISTYQTMLVPGLLQTPEYMTTVIRTAWPDAPDTEIVKRVRLRVERQALLDAPGAPRLWVVLDEAVLCRPIGGTKVFKEQLRHLVDATVRPHVTVQVLPFERGAHPALGGSLTLLNFPEDPETAYTEQLGSSLYMVNPETVRHYRSTLDHLRAQALPPDDSVQMIRVVTEE